MSDRARRGAGWRRGGRIVAVGLATVGAIGAFTAGSSAQVAQTTQAPFTGTAAADLGRASVSVTPAIVSETLADPGAVTAQAGLDSLGNSTAFAADPFPGTLVGQLPGLLAGAVGAPSLPDLVPTLVSSSYPQTPSARFGLGPLEIRADSDVARSEGSVTDGVNRGRAFVTNDPSTGAVVARAESVVGGLELGGLLSVSGYRSTAELRRLEDGTVKPSVTMSIARITVLGQAFSIGPDGVNVLGTNLPLPGARDLLDTLIEQLAGQGIGFTILDPVVTAESVVAAGIVVTYETDVPNVGHATTSVTFGQTVATLSSRVRNGDDAGPGPLGEVPTVSDLGSIGSSGGSFDLPSTPILDPPVPGAASSRVTPQAVAPALQGVADTTPIGRIYPWLFGIGCLLFLSISAHHQLGEKQWTS
jgi:hypothetical protein